MTSDEERLGELYHAFNARDVERLMAYLHADVDWPNGWEGGRLHGIDAVRDYWQRQWVAISPTVEPRGFGRDPEGRVVVCVHQVVRDLDGNVRSDGDVRHVYTLIDGAVSRMDIAGPAEHRGAGD